MLEQDNEFYVPYGYRVPTQPLTPVSVGVIDNSPSPTGWPVPQASQPPSPPVGPLPPASPPQKPRRRAGRTAAIVLLTLVLAAIFGVGLFAGWEFSNNPNSNGTNSSAVTTSSTSSAQSTSSTSANTLEALQEAAIAKIEPSVVELDVTTSQGQAIGSGVIIDSNGDIVTNNHVVSGEQSIQVLLSNGKTEQGQLVGTDAADDLAVVRITPFAHMVVAQIGDSSQLSVGQEVLAIGNPLGITETATQGIVSALNRSVSESNGVTISNAIQTDAPINPGNSGGALINLQGELVGIPTLGAVNTESNTPANGLGFAIPSSLVKTAVQQILQNGNI
ncbi:MAG TPA: trypsin-like peptidase domain-containing protein [Ktedonobacteraceae bacterium]|nr:trypsin-like peptidase domain-containing protein [Ktedonobacteraceae bacterium]